MVATPLILSNSEDPLPSPMCIYYYKPECLPMWFFLELVVSLVLLSTVEAQLGSYIYSDRLHSIILLMG